MVIIVIKDNEFTLLEEYQNQSRRFVYRFLKRTFDIVASLLGLLLLFPVFLIVSLAIKKEDVNGPVFYFQYRVGRHGKRFKMYKFRSMVVNADKILDSLAEKNEVDGAMFKMKNDPRVTHVGNFIRRHSIDELPQLVNVLIGDMSLVGTRPPLIREVSEYTEYEKKRLVVKPGCTGLWQVSGRNDLDFKEMVDLDIEYISRSSLALDITILLRTVLIMIKPNSAY
ncbi:sugar transferase [Pediococcus claussenii]|uniref:Bacterial sugar transferase family protein n=1 Tax=Pediococcus claussenii (strain ATCC BAA-344 / DSM 14800 / JCM 18046 / KCTC 3811 / LMG 21948 / P06) TaxID=701521 RepID=G8PE04_PEDCP|nr:sugar transferase [Pediococcus claussenii]AEV95489.1 bacterial sugar transferase family protein [Pediococcus claussenii ATCC BAA-344]ANZ69013.1 multidrug MFS transporter [Pediococcus claussenii]ANZ70829.1 multidrug MFS transporter [Pediococcus claussenii]